MLPLFKLTEALGTGFPAASFTVPETVPLPRKLTLDIATWLVVVRDPVVRPRLPALSLASMAKFPNGTKSNVNRPWVSVVVVTNADPDKVTFTPLPTAVMPSRLKTVPLIVPEGPRTRFTVADWLGGSVPEVFARNPPVRSTAVTVKLPGATPVI